jgi:hypothetical protein
LQEVAAIEVEAGRKIGTHDIAPHKDAVTVPSMSEDIPRSSFRRRPESSLISMP